MSGSYWPQQVARQLHDDLGFEHPLIQMPPEEVADFLRVELSKVPIEEFVPGL
mgnify:CR=1 FL=1